MKPQHWLVAAGAVIIENNRVLLVKEKKENKLSPWYFPGGQVEDFDQSFEATAIREAKEEVGLDITITKTLRPILVHQNTTTSIVLIHYLANYTGVLAKGKEGFIAEADWHPIDNLPKDVAPNVQTIINDLRMI